MQARLSFSILLFSTFLLLASPAFSAGGGAPSGESISPGCQVAMDTAAGNYSRCLLRAEAGYAVHENQSTLEKRQASCERHFDRRTDRATQRSGWECPSSDLVTSMKDRTESYAGAIATEARGEPVVSQLYVQISAGGSLTETTLTLSGIDESTSWFAERPYREVGRITTTDFVALFYEEGPNSFAMDPPNADFTCEMDGKAVAQEVVLKEPKLDPINNTLTYQVTLVQPEGNGDSFSGITCQSGTSLFIDSGGSNPVCSSGYNCFIGAFCSTAASYSLPSPGSLTGWSNVYAGDTPASAIPAALGCGVPTSDNGEWSNGVSYFNSLLNLADESTDPQCQFDPLNPQSFPCSITSTVVAICGSR